MFTSVNVRGRGSSCIPLCSGAEKSYGLSLRLISTLRLSKRMDCSLLAVLLTGLVVCHGQDCVNLPCFGCTNPGSNIMIICVAGGLTSFPLLPEDVQPRVEQLNLRSNAISEIAASNLVNYTILETL